MITILNYFYQEQLQLNLLQQTHLSAMPSSTGGSASVGANNKVNKQSLSNLQQQQQQIMAQMQITQQALMLGQNMDSDNDLPIKSKGKDISGVLPDTGYPLSSSFSLGTKKPSRQVRHSKAAIN